MITRIGLLLVAGLALAACGDDGTGPAPTQPSTGNDQGQSIDTSPSGPEPKSIDTFPGGPQPKSIDTSPSGPAK
jgi:hypothetical protein